MNKREQLVGETQSGWPDYGSHDPGEFLEAFLEELEQNRSLFDWKLIPDSGKPSEKRGASRYQLRGICRRGPAAGAVFEPIGALCYAKTGAVYTEDTWSGAARALGLPSLCVAELIAAANDHTWAGPPGRRQPVAHLRGLRLRLIRAVRLRSRPRPVERIRDAFAPAVKSGPARH